MPEKDDRKRQQDADRAETRSSARDSKLRPDFSPEDEFDEEDEGTTLEEERELDAALADQTRDEVEVVHYDDDEDALIIGADDENVTKDMAQYTEDEEVRDEFAERQKLHQGSKDLLMKLREHHSKTPDLTADDIDAAWDDANVGDETVGGTAPTPDQDQVDELGEAVGLMYEDDEPLGIQDKMREREQDRWELDPESAEDEEDEELDELDDLEDEDEFDDFDEFDDEDDYDDLDDEDDYDDFDDEDALDDELDY